MRRLLAGCVPEERTEGYFDAALAFAESRWDDVKTTVNVPGNSEDGDVRVLVLAGGTCIPHAL